MIAKVLQLLKTSQFTRKILFLYAMNVTDLPCIWKNMW